MTLEQKGEAVKGVVHQPSGTIVEHQTLQQRREEKRFNYLRMVAKQKNEISNSENYEVRNLSPGKYPDGYGRTLVVKEDNTTEIRP